MKARYIIFGVSNGGTFFAKRHLEKNAAISAWERALTYRYVWRALIEVTFNPIKAQLLMAEDYSNEP